MIRTDTAYSDNIDEELPQTSNKGHPYEPFNCPSHPGYKLEVMCTKENFTPSLLCIKCLIDPEVHKHSDSFVPIHDAISRGVTTRVSQSQLKQAKDKLEKRLIEFTSIDYLRVYERHADNQLKKLEREVGKIKESLDSLQAHFKQLFDKEQKYLNEKQEEIKAKIQEFIDEQEQIDTLENLSSEEILEAVEKITNVREYEKLVKVLYHRGSLSERGSEGAMVSEIFAVMDDLKSKVNTMKNYRIETSRLEDIRQRVESLEMFDHSLQAFPSSVNPDLLETLEKIRRVENKRSRPVSPKQEANSSLKKRAEFLGPIQDKLANREGRNGHDEFNTKREKMSEEDRSASRSPNRGYYDETRYEDDDDRRRYDDDDRRRYDDDRYYKRQKVHPDSYRERALRRAQHDEEEDNEHYDNDVPHSGDFGTYDNDEFTFNEPPKSSLKPKIQKPKIQKSSTVKKKNKSSNKEENRKSSTKRADEGKGTKNKSSQKHKGSVDKQSKGKDKSSKKKKQYESSDESSVGSGKKTERGVHNLHDWINRRVTGYLIFQNSTHFEKNDDEDHLNSVTGKKWKALTKSEKEEYKSIALNARVELKKEFDDVDIDDSETKDLQERIEKKLKKIKKDEEQLSS